MKRQKIDGHIERQLLIALVTSKEFLSQAIMVMDLDLIDIPYFRRIAGWCVDYFKKYKTSPGKDIQTTFHSWEEGITNKEEITQADAIADLLESLSDQWEDNDPLNVPYLLDQLRTYLERKSLKRLQDNLDFALHIGHEEDAKNAILNFKPIEVMSGMGIDPLRDKDTWARAFSISQEPLIEFPGDAGKFLNNSLVRDGLIGIQAPEKRGKTFWCIEFVVRALKERRKVAFFQVGDLSEHQVMIRLGMYFAQRPSKKQYCGRIELPNKIKPPREEGEEIEVEHNVKNFDRPLTEQACLKAAQKLMKGYGLNPNKSYLKVSIHSNSSINIQGISSILDYWEMMEGFIPDIIVIDYADILAPENSRELPRDQVNSTWKAMRRLSQERHCLVIAPTQADAASYGQQTQSMKNFSEDKRKIAHVTGMLGLNQTDEEKEIGVMRLNWIALREGYFNSKKCLWVGQCLPIGRAYYCATL